MNYFSVCDGIGAAHAALLPLGYRCVGVSGEPRLKTCYYKRFKQHYCQSERRER